MKKRSGFPIAPAQIISRVSPAARELALQQNRVSKARFSEDTDQFSGNG
jgi:hypothetical protein